VGVIGERGGEWMWMSERICGSESGRGFGFGVKFYLYSNIFVTISFFYQKIDYVFQQTFLGVSLYQLQTLLDVTDNQTLNQTYMDIKDIL